MGHDALWLDSLSDDWVSEQGYLCSTPSDTAQEDIRCESEPIQSPRQRSRDSLVSTAVVIGSSTVKKQPRHPRLSNDMVSRDFQGRDLPSGMSTSKGDAALPCQSIHTVRSNLTILPTAAANEEDSVEQGPSHSSTSNGSHPAANYAFHKFQPSATCSVYQTQLTNDLGAQVLDQSLQDQCPSLPEICASSSIVSMDDGDLLQWKGVARKERSMPCSQNLSVLGNFDVLPSISDVASSPTIEVATFNAPTGGSAVEADDKPEPCNSPSVTPQDRRSHSKFAVESLVWSSENSGFSPVYVSKHSTTNGDVRYAAMQHSSNRKHSLWALTSTTPDSHTENARIGRDSRLSKDSVVNRWKLSQSSQQGNFSEHSCPKPRSRDETARHQTEDCTACKSEDHIVQSNLEEKTCRPVPPSLIGRKRKDARYEPVRDACNPGSLAHRPILRPKRSVSGSSQATIRHAASERPNAEQLRGLSGELTPSLEEKRGNRPSSDLLAVLKRSCKSSRPAICSCSVVRKPSVSTQDYLDEATKVMQLIRLNSHPEIRMGNMIDSFLSKSARLPLHRQDLIPRMPSQTRSRREGLMWRVKKADEIEPHTEEHFQHSWQHQTSGRESKFGSICSHSSRTSSSKLDVHCSDRTSHHSVTPAKAGSYVDPESRLKRQQLDTSRSVMHVRAACMANIGPSQVNHLIHSGGGEMLYDVHTQRWRRRADVFQSCAHELTDSPAGTDDDPLREISDLEVDARQEAHRLQMAVADASVAIESQSGESLEASDGIEVAAAFWGTRERQVSDEDLQMSYRALDADSSVREDTFVAPADGVPALVNYDWQLRGRAKGASSSRAHDIAQAYTCEAESRSQSATWHIPHISEVNCSSFMEFLGVGSKSNMGLDKRCMTGHAYTTDFDDDRAISFVQQQPNGRTMSLSFRCSTPASQKRFPDSIAGTQNFRSSVIFSSLTPVSDLWPGSMSSIRVHEPFSAPKGVNLTTVPRNHSRSAAIDRLVAKLTDAEPDEPYWDWLTRLDLGDTGLTTLYMLDDFCPHLRELDISQNRLQFLEGLPRSILQLKANANLLSGLTCWTKLSFLQYLDISANQMETLSGLAGLVHLRELKANDSGITDIRGVLHLNGLLKLSLAGNLLRAVDFTDSSLHRLTDLCLSQNRLRKLRGLQFLPSIAALDVRSNRLTALDLGSTKRTLDCLRLLCADENDIAVLNISNAPALETVSAGYNVICDIQGAEKHHRLRSLLLMYQRSREARVAVGSMWHRFCNLEELVLSGNFMTSISTKARCPKLRCLDLANMDITAIDKHFVHMVPKLQTLNLRNNAIEDMRALGVFKKLTNLDLSGNRLGRLRKIVSVLARLPQLQLLDLRGNPLTARFYIQSKDHDVGSFRKSGVADQDDSLEGFPDRELFTSEPTFLSNDDRLAKRLYELLLAFRCKKLAVLDGSACGPHEMTTKTKDHVWNELLDSGLVYKA